MEHATWKGRKASPATILVVEDDPLIRMSAAELLRDHGWNVEEAHCADAAVAHLEVDTTVALVFSDIQMPGSMDGVALARWVRNNRPGVRVMLTSGAVRNVEPGLCDSELIGKPYMPDFIIARIGQLLDLASEQTPRLHGDGHRQPDSSPHEIIADVIAEPRHGILGREISGRSARE